MRLLPRPGISQLVFFALAAMLLLVGVPQRAAAQGQGQDIRDEACFEVTGNTDCDVLGISAISADTSSSDVDGYTETVIYDYTIVDYDDYDAYVEGEMLFNDDVVDSGDEDGCDDNDDCYDAVVNLDSSVTPGTYSVEADHWLLDLDGIENIDLGSTGPVSITAGAPVIDSISPTCGIVGTSDKSISITGQNLIDPFTEEAKASVPPESGMEISGVSGNSTDVTLGYTLPTTASTGNLVITLTNRFGSGTGDFTVGDPTPVVESVDPDVWPAGPPTFQVTITGTGFGTNPGVDVSGTGVTYQVVSTSDKEIVLNITVDLSAPSGPATVTVTSRGYLGSSFVSACGTVSDDTGDATVLAAPVPPPPPAPPVPQIFLGLNNTTDIAGTTPAVLAGQQIILTACIDPDPANCTAAGGAPGNPPAGTTITSQSWTISGTTIGGWTPGLPPAPVSPLDQGTVTFYWAAPVPGAYAVTYTYYLSNNTQPGTAQAIFYVDAPIGVTETIVQSTMTVLDPPLPMPYDTLNGENTILVNVGSGFPGIEFVASAEYLPPAGGGLYAGTYEWAQVINSDTAKIINSRGAFTNNLLTQTQPNELDTAFPYGYFANGTPTGAVKTTIVTNDTAMDGPSLDLPPSYGEAARSFKATMYLMWVPNAANGCTGNACTVSIPLGATAWQFQGDAFNTLVQKTVQTSSGSITFPIWNLNYGANPDCCTNGGFQGGGPLPQWSGIDNPQ